MRVVVFEPRLRGHHAPWLVHTLDALRTMVGVDVALVTLTSFDSALARVPDLGRAATGVTVLPILEDSENRPPRENAKVRTRQLQSVLDEGDADWVYVPYADGVSQVAAASTAFRSSLRRSGATVEAIQFRGPVCYPELGGRLRARAHWLASELSPWTYRHHVDPLYVDGPTAPRHLRPWGVFPDAVEPPATVLSHQQAREQLGLPADGRLLVTAGLLGEFKGTIDLVRAFLSARKGPQDYLVLAGPHDKELATFLRGCPQGSLISRDEWIAPEQLPVYLQAATAVATTYPAHVGSASIVLRAASCGRSVLGSTTGWQGRIIPAFGLGLTVEPRHDAVVDGIERALDTGTDHILTSAAPRLLAFNSPANFRAHVVDHARRRGVATGEGLPIRWEDECLSILLEHARTPSGGRR